MLTTLPFIVAILVLGDGVGLLALITQAESCGLIVSSVSNATALPRGFHLMWIALPHIDCKARWREYWPAD